MLTAKSLQSCPTLCHHIDDSPPGAPVPGILQAPYMRDSKRDTDVKNSILDSVGEGKGGKI